MGVSFLGGLTPDAAEQFQKEHTLPPLHSHLPLSNPRGVTYRCEICSRESCLQCSLCNRTFYCSVEHQQIDWESVHCKLCPFICALRSPPPILSTQEERIGRSESVLATKRFVLSVCKAESFRHLNENRPKLAHSAGIQALRYASDIFGSSALELVPPFLLLAEAGIACQDFDRAQEHLCQAKWILIQHPSADALLLAQHARNFGRLCASQRQFDKALKYLAADVFFTATERGPCHVETTFGLFLMGTVFLEKGDLTSAAPFFDQVVQIWTSSLVSALQPAFVSGVAELPPPKDWGEGTSRLGLHILKKVVEGQIDIHGPTQMPVGHAYFAHGLLMGAIGDWKESFRLLVQASQLFEMTAGIEHTVTRECRRFLQLAQRKKSLSQE